MLVSKANFQLQGIFYKVLQCVVDLLLKSIIYRLKGMTCTVFSKELMVKI